VLAEIGCRVFTVEIIGDIAARSRKILEDLGYSNITYKIDDGYNGWEEYAPFEAIIVTAAPPDIPDKLIGQLTLSGKLVIRKACYPGRRGETGALINKEN
jgi:protein-L-isoaspartate(D-aspartate) O-methyltransferase